jgi:hypothetical protein
MPGSAGYKSICYRAVVYDRYRHGVFGSQSMRVQVNPTLHLAMLLFKFVSMASWSESTVANQES